MLSIIYYIYLFIAVNTFQCDVQDCSWAFYSACKLKRHKETHLSVKSYACTLEGCSKTFSTKYNLKSHEKLHHRPRKFKCQIAGCPEIFQTTNQMHKHLKNHDAHDAPFQYVLMLIYYIKLFIYRYVFFVDAL